MAFKQIAVVASGDAEDEVVLAAAAAIAAREGALARITPAFRDPAAEYFAYGAALTQTRGAQAARITAAENDAQARIERLAQAAFAAPARVHVGKREMQPAHALAEEATLADLVMFGGAAARGGGLGGLFAETLLSHRAATLVVNRGGALDGPAAVAWDGSAQAGRALRAALPLLKAARGVLLLSNVEDCAPEAMRPSAERARDYLALHGVADVALRSVRGSNVARSLLEAAQADKCGLLACGGYGRPRLYELALGGTTRALVGAENAPHLLLMH